MSNRLFSNENEVSARAMYVGQRLDLRSIEQGQRLASAPLAVTAGAQGAAVLFRYGVVVLFGVNAVEEAAFINNMRPFIVQPFESYEAEDVNLHRNEQGEEGIINNRIEVKGFDIETLQVVADVMAKSVVLGHYEGALAKTFDRIEPLALKLQSGKSFMHQARELLQHLGDVLLIQGKMVGRVEVSEKPEMLWENPQFERLYLRLEDEFELVERHTALERKLELVSKTAETLLDLLQSRRSLRVEWYIVILIVVEIFLTLYELWWQ